MRCCENLARAVFRCFPFFDEDGGGGYGDDIDRFIIIIPHPLAANLATSRQLTYSKTFTL